MMTNRVWEERWKDGGSIGNDHTDHLINLLALVVSLCVFPLSFVSGGFVLGSILFAGLVLGWIVGGDRDVEGGLVVAHVLFVCSVFEL